GRSLRTRRSSDIELPLCHLHSSLPPAQPPSCCFRSAAHHHDLHSFPTRRSSDLRDRRRPEEALGGAGDPALAVEESEGELEVERDRKSTRLNSSHSQISYAVFCLKKKNENQAARNTEVLLARMVVMTSL